ncbi:MAG: hypothetical protein JWO82_1911 [Akkermansiaceae bacterium]|nr:hypothetical protein [Akkermansiaceae bacterium]
MATAQREKNGSFTATWRDAEGKRRSVATGETIFERALKKAQAIEAEARFWEDQVEGLWQRLADAGFSPRYLHTLFIGRAHMPFPVFKRLLGEGSIRFKAASAWRDRAKPRGKPSGRKWKLNGESLTLDELLEKADPSISRATLRFRLDQGWEVQKALETPLLSRAESGRRGADVSNKPKGKAA